MYHKIKVFSPQHPNLETSPDLTHYTSRLESVLGLLSVLYMFSSHLHEFSPGSNTVLFCTEPERGYDLRRCKRLLSWYGPKANLKQMHLITNLLDGQSKSQTEEETRCSTVKQELFVCCQLAHILQIVWRRQKHSIHERLGPQDHSRK